MGHDQRDLDGKADALLLCDMRLSGSTSVCCGYRRTNCGLSRLQVNGHLAPLKTLHSAALRLCQSHREHRQVTVTFDKHPCMDTSFCTCNACIEHGDFAGISYCMQGAQSLPCYSLFSYSQLGALRTTALCNKHLYWVSCSTDNRLEFPCRRLKTCTPMTQLHCTSVQSFTTSRPSLRSSH